MHVEEIISDTLLKITYSINLPQEEQGNGHAFKIAPHVDQTAVYDEVYHYLNNHECITIFPEGGSHDRSEMLPLKGNAMEKWIHLQGSYFFLNKLGLLSWLLELLLQIQV